MLLGFQENLDDSIVKLLGKDGPTSVQSLHSALPSKPTVQAIYQALRRLIKIGVIVKVKKTYALKLSWCTELYEYAQRAHAKTIATMDIPRKGEKVTSWLLPNLSTALNLWAQLTTALFLRQTGPSLLEWAPHAWFHLVHGGIEDQFQRMLTYHRAEYLLIVGHDTPLDRSYARYFKGTARKLSYSESPLAGTKEYFSVIGEYYIELRLPESFVMRVDETFSSTRSVTADALILVQRILNEPVSARLKLRHLPKKTQRIRRIFDEFF